jgi:hypothetical protein
VSEIKNAIIKSATLSSSDHGALCGWLRFEFGGGVEQSFGGLALYPGTINYAGKWIQRCLDIAGVYDWSELPGRCVRVKLKGELIVAIGHVLEEYWFNPQMEFEALKMEFDELYEKRADNADRYNARFAGDALLFVNDRDFAAMYRDRPE